MKAMTLRLPEEQADAVRQIAHVDEDTVTEITKKALAKYIEERHKDEVFQRRAQAAAEKLIKLGSGTP